jgi:hypothetical protein
MAATKWKGQIAEVAVISEAVKRGYRVSLPMSEDCPYDLVIERIGRDDHLARVQCKYTESTGAFVLVRCRTSNQSCEIRYTADDVDWIATYDATTQDCYFVPSSMLGPFGRTALHLRLAPTRNRQATGIWWARDFMDW